MSAAEAGGFRNTNYEGAQVAAQAPGMPFLHAAAVRRASSRSSQAFALSGKLRNRYAGW